MARGLENREGIVIVPPAKLFRKPCLPAHHNVDVRILLVLWRCDEQEALVVARDHVTVSRNAGQHLVKQRIRQAGFTSVRGDFHITLAEDSLD